MVWPEEPIDPRLDASSGRLPPQQSRSAPAFLLTEALRQFLAQKLPAYMVPDHRSIC